MQHHRPEPVVRVADRQRYVTLARKGETIGFELIFQYFLVDHDALTIRFAHPTLRVTIYRSNLFLRMESAVTPCREKAEKAFKTYLNSAGSKASVWRRRLAVSGSTPRSRLFGSSGLRI